MSAFLWGMLGGAVSFVLLFIGTIVWALMDQCTVEELFSHKSDR